MVGRSVGYGISVVYFSGIPVVSFSWIPVVCFVGTLEGLHLWDSGG
jgi:hypothetical protein